MSVKNDLPGKNSFGTFAGVFTPCFLTILGVILFLRTGMVVGEAGLWMALVVLLLSKTITILTSISLSAIATNTKVKGGGAYFLISRSLGAEFGGAIGLAFFLAQAVSVALYVIGFADTLGNLIAYHHPKIIGAITAVLILSCVYIGASWVLKIQFFVMSALVVSLTAFFIGAYQQFDGQIFSHNLTSAYSTGKNFWYVFAIFFPAVTGVMAGANMSGDLKAPARSLPQGTFAAVFVTALIYAAAFCCLAGCASRETLQKETFIFQRIAVQGPLCINLGIFAATLSSALGSFVGAPRILQALARDRIFPSLQFWGAGAGRTQEPRRAVLLTFVIAMSGILFCDLNVIAPVITMFFLVTYGILNFAAFYESRADNPSFRPTFRIYHWSTGLLGALGCLAMMFLIHAVAALIAILIIAALYHYVAKKKIRTQWGDVKSGYLFKTVRDNLIRLEHEQVHPKNWRPQILVLSGNPHTRPHLVQCAAWLEGQRGLLIVSNIITTGTFQSVLPYLRSQHDNIKKFMQHHGFEGLVQVIWAPDFHQGMIALLQIAGIGRLCPNTLLLGMCEDTRNHQAYTQTIQDAISMQKNILIFKASAVSQERIFQGIDIWWRGMENGQLMLLYAFLLKSNACWSQARIRILRIVTHEAARDMARNHLQELIQAARVPADIEVIVSQAPPAEIIQRESRQADLVFLGLPAPVEGQGSEFTAYLHDMGRRLANVLFVKCSSEVGLLA